MKEVLDILYGIADSMQGILTVMREIAEILRGL